MLHQLIEHFRLGSNWMKFSWILHFFHVTFFVESSSQPISSDAWHNGTSCWTIINEKYLVICHANYFQQEKKGSFVNGMMLTNITMTTILLGSVKYTISFTHLVMPKCRVIIIRTLECRRFLSILNPFWIWRVTILKILCIHDISR